MYQAWNLLSSILNFGMSNTSFPGLSLVEFEYWGLKVVEYSSSLIWHCSKMGNQNSKPEGKSLTKSLVESFFGKVPISNVSWDSVLEPVKPLESLETEFLDLVKQ